MAETQQQQEPELHTDGQGGIVGFYAEATASRNYQAEKFGIEYRFGDAASYIDAVQQFAEVQAQAQEQASASLDQRLAQEDAAKAKASPKPTPQPAAQQQPPTPPPPTEEPAPADAEAAIVDDGGQLVDDQPAGGLPVQVGTSPKGGQVRYVPTSALPSRAFEDAVKDQIAGLGYDRDEFIVFDNRISREGSQYAGLEEGGKSYGPATVKAKKDTRAATMIQGAAFYVDFSADGKVEVKPTRDAESYQKAAAAFAGGGQ